MIIIIGEHLYHELEAPVKNGIYNDTIVDSSVISINNPYYEISIEEKKGILILELMLIVLLDIVQVLHWYMMNQKQHQRESRR